MVQLTDQTTLVLLSDATVPMIDAAFLAVADDGVDLSRLHRAFLERREAMIAGELPEVLWLICDETGPAGWLGWAPYKERPHHWQTTTYFSEVHRGTGLFDRARCVQLHAAVDVEVWSAAKGLPVTFMLSIASWNTRSLAASRRYAKVHGWPDTWEQVFEPVAGRDAHVFTFPFPNPPHSCFAPNAGF